MKYYVFLIIICSVFILITQQVTAVEAITQTTHFQKVVKTAKERLGKKASDEQRVNNCKVPIEKRGTKWRPDKCD